MFCLSLTLVLVTVFSSSTSGKIFLLLVRILILAPVDMPGLPGLVSSFSLGVPITKLTMLSGDSFAGVDESEKGICLNNVFKIYSLNQVL